MNTRTALLSAFATGAIATAASGQIAAIDGFGAGQAADTGATTVTFTSAITITGNADNKLVLNVGNGPKPTSGDFTTS
ncbi:MAG: hypothetical protein ACFB21_15070 [Opitutales bacterium]